MIFTLRDASKRNVTESPLAHNSFFRYIFSGEEKRPNSDEEKKVPKQPGHISKPIVHALRINLFPVISLPVIIVSVLIS